MERWGVLAGFEGEVILLAQMLFHRVKVCAACLHLPLAVGIVCLMITNNYKRSSQETLVFPPKTILMFCFALLSTLTLFKDGQFKYGVFDKEPHSL